MFKAFNKLESSYKSDLFFLHVCALCNIFWVTILNEYHAKNKYAAIAAQYRLKSLDSGLSLANFLSPRSVIGEIVWAIMQPLELFKMWILNYMQ